MGKVIFEKENQTEIVQNLLLSKEIKKVLFESNRTYRTYWLSKIMPNGTEKDFKYINNAGKLTHFWDEKLIEGKWKHIDDIPPDAFVGGNIAIIKNGEIVIHNTCDYFGLSIN